MKKEDYQKEVVFILEQTQKGLNQLNEDLKKGIDSIKKITIDAEQKIESKNADSQKNNSNDVSVVFIGGTENGTTSCCFGPDNIIAAQLLQFMKEHPAIVGQMSIINTLLK